MCVSLTSEDLSMSDGPFERTGRTNIEMMRKIAWAPKQDSHQPKCGEPKCFKRAFGCSVFCRKHAEEFYSLKEA